MADVLDGRQLAAAPPGTLDDDATRADVARALPRAAVDGAVVASAARLPHRGWLVAAAAVLLSVAITATAVCGCDEPAVPRGSTSGPAPSMQPDDEPTLATDDGPAPARADETAAARAGRAEAAREVSVSSRPPVDRAEPRGERDDGYLMINTSPWSRVYLDGRDIGNTPIVRHRVAAGRHTLELRPRGKLEDAVRRTIVVEAGQTHRLVLRL